MLQEILPVFNNLEGRANTIADEDEAEAFFNTMEDLRQATINLYTTGIYHLLEQQLMDVCRDRTFFDPKHPVPKDTDLKTVAAWYKNRLDINLRQLPAWHKIRELECVANTVKHGEGPSATKLRKIRPDLFEHPVTRTILPKSSWNAVQEDPLELRSPLAGDLYITKEQFAEFAGTAEKFLREIVDYFEKHADEYYPRE